MAETVTSITRSTAIKLINESIENFFTFYDSYCYDNKKDLSDEQKDLYDQMNEAMMIVKNDKNYRNDLKIMPLPDLTDLLLMCKKMVDINDLFTKSSYPKGKFVIVENKNDDSTGTYSNINLIEKSLAKLELHGDLQIQKAIREWKNGERAIMFADMAETALGETRQKNDFYTHYINSNFSDESAENEVRVAITLAHEFKRKANSNTLTGETRDIILEDTKIIETFANSYGEDIYKKFPEYGILHYIKKIFGETELKEFADYAFDSTGSYWKVSSNGDLVDNGNISKVFDANDKEIHTGIKGLQGTLQEWLGIENAYESLMQPAGFEWDGSEWKKNPGVIRYSIINEAFEKGNLTDKQYQLIKTAAYLIEESDEKSINEKKSEKTNHIQKMIRTLKKSIKTSLQLELINNVIRYFVLGRNIKDNNSQVITSTVQKSKNVQFTNEIEKKILDKSDGVFYKQPENFIGNFNPSTMSQFIQDEKGSKCNLFLEEVTQNLSEEIAKKILPNGIKSAAALHQEFKHNEHLKSLNPDSHAQSDRSKDQLLHSAEEAANKANEMANAGYLVIAASPNYAGYTAHVAFVIAQENTYDFDYNPDLSYQICYQGTTGLDKHQQSTVDVLWDYPVFLQAGNSTGIVPPGSAFSRILFNDDKVDYYVIKK